MVVCPYVLAALPDSLDMCDRPAPLGHESVIRRGFPGGQEIEKVLFELYGKGEKMLLFWHDDLRLRRLMMKGIKAGLALLIVARFMVSGLTCYAQPNIPEDNIPSNIPANVREKIEGLYSVDPVKRAEAAADLGVMGHRAAPAIPFLIGMFGDEILLVEDAPGSFRYARYPVDSANTCPASQAAKALRKIGKPAVEPLIASLRSENWIFRAHASATLGGMEDPRVVEPLILTLADENRIVRINTAIALGRIRALRSVDPLIAALEDEDWLVRRYVARSLGELGDTRAVKPLIDALSDKGFRAAGDAAEALHKITGQDFGLDPEKWQRWWEKNREA